jgi:hypothetical protein
MPSYGRVEEFNAKDSWQEYAERLECYFSANEVAEAKRACILLSVCGPSTYSVIGSLVSPRTPNSVPYGEIVKLLQDHYNPRPSAIVSRFHFHQCRQGANQKIVEFVAELRRLSEHCEFGEQLEDMLRDRLVCGVNDLQLQRQLLATPNLTFARAQQDALAMETAQLQMKELRPTSSVTVQQVHTNTKKYTDRTPCMRCGGNHAAATCRWINEECRYCHKTGHIARVCLSKKKDDDVGGGKKKEYKKEHKKQSVGQVYTAETPESYGIFNVSNQTPISPR